jgi:phage terminase large subunit-like protein
MDLLDELSEWLAPADTWSRWYCDKPDCDGKPHGRWHWCDHPILDHPIGVEYSGCMHARAAQRPPADDRWNIWLLMSGRGFGKSRSGAEWVVEQAKTYPDSLWGVVAPTWNDVIKCRDDHTAGLVAVAGDLIAKNNLSTGRITLTNGAVIQCVGAERPDRLRGFNFWGAWVDELSSWVRPDSWHLGLVPALRLGPHPRVVVTTTPKPVQLVRDLAKRDDGSVSVTTGSTWDNHANLAETALSELRARYEGTRSGRQELYGELLEDVEGALWSLAQIDRLRVDRLPEALTHIAVAIDPAGGSSENNDETGIVVVGRAGEHGYLLADRSGRFSPQGWAQRAIAAYHEFAADRIVAEVNYGGAMVESTLRSAGFTGWIDLVTASRGKRQRAEPIAALYGDPSNPDTWERGRIHHVGAYPPLEDQMTMWVPESGDSPDRMDALVWGITSLKFGGISTIVPFDDDGPKRALNGTPLLEPVGRLAVPAEHQFANIIQATPSRERPDSLY